MQGQLFAPAAPDLEPPGKPPAQLLKWIGSKRRSAAAIVLAFPRHFNTYHEPFLGGGAVLGLLKPKRAVASDRLRPLIEIWQTLGNDLPLLCQWYAQRWQTLQGPDKVAQYRILRDRYNVEPNGGDLLMLSRACYGGVIRFTKDGAMNTPCGPHKPIPPEAFAKRAADWQQRTAGTTFIHADFAETLDAAKAGDLVYCDPPYADSEATLYGAQAFTLERLFQTIDRCKARGVYVALSIDGWKRSGSHACAIPMPDGLFESDAPMVVGRSMLRRFQMQGQTLEEEVVADRLLRTWKD